MQVARKSSSGRALQRCLLTLGVAAMPSAAQIGPHTWVSKKRDMPCGPRLPFCATRQSGERRRSGPSLRKLRTPNLSRSVQWMAGSDSLKLFGPILQP